MRTIFLSLCLLFCLAGFSQSFTLSGRISSPYEGKVYLWYGDKVDSTTVANREFSFSGAVDYPIKASLSVSPKLKDTGFFVLEPGDLSVDIAIENRYQVYLKSINGSASLQEVKDFLIFKSKNISLSNLPDLMMVRLEKMFKREPRSQFAGILLADLMTDRQLPYRYAQKLYNLLDKKTQDKEDLQMI